jgi:Thrombospondin type 3 repeat
MKAVVPASATIAAALALAACYAPRFEDGQACSAMLQCPAGQRCDTSVEPPVCRAVGEADAGVTDGAAADADPDDGDGDGVRDPDDNCPTVPNPEQRDHDGDAIGDRCDNCPATANPDQANLGEGTARDGVGDACDPWPNEGGDTIAFFDGFDALPIDPRWTSQVPMTISEGRLVLDPDAPLVSATLVWTESLAVASRVALEYRAVVTEMADGADLAVELERDGDGANSYYQCRFRRNAPLEHRVELFRTVAGVDQQLGPQRGAQPPQPTIFHRLSYRRDTDVNNRGRLECDVSTTDVRNVEGSSLDLDPGAPAITLDDVAATIDHVVIYQGRP